jgi:hypothetical protein
VSSATIPPGRVSASALMMKLVVHAVPAAVVARVVQPHVGERDVADRCVEVPVGQPRVGERLGADRRARVQRPGDRGAGRIELDADGLGAPRRHPDERAGAGAGLEHAAAGEAQALERRPHLPHVGGVGVVGVDRRAPRRGVGALVEQRPQPRALRRPLVARLVEDLRHRPPARPAREHLLFGGAGRAILGLERAQNLQRRQVGCHARSRARRRQVILAARPKR